MGAMKTVFMFSGQGSHYFQMGRPLFDADPVFRERLLQLDAVAQRVAGLRVLEAIHGSGKAETFDRTLLTHPAIFMLEVALAQRLMHDGLQPDLVLGASLGSFAAAVIAGHLDAGDAMAAVIEQARAFEAACAPGGMVAVLGDPRLHEEDFLHRRSELAGINFDGHFVVSAAQAELEPIEAGLKLRGVTYQRLAVSFAFHSRHADAARERFTAFMRQLPRAGGTLPLVCCAQARTLDRLPDDFFWHAVREPLRFRDAVRHLEAQGAHRYVDLGPSGTLATFVKYALPPGSASRAHAILTPYGQDLKNLAALRAAC